MNLNEITGAFGFVVYKVSSPNTHYVYYGYTKGHDIKTEFLKAAARQDELRDRGAPKLLELAGGEEDLRFDELEIFSDEVEALVARNDLRTADGSSITTATPFPTQAFLRAKTLHPEKVHEWFKKNIINTMSARKAMGMPESKINYNNLKELTKSDPLLKTQIITDLDNILYPDFLAKYFPSTV